MLHVLKLLLARFVLARYLTGTLGSLVIVVPLAAILSAVGAPLLATLGTVAVPVLVILALVGLPIIAVLLFGALLVGLVGLVMLLGLVVVKLVLFVVLPLALILWVVRRLRGGGSGSVAPAATAAGRGG